MPANGTYSSSAASALVGLAPRDNWASRHAQKQAELQYANILESRARQDANELQQNIAQQMQTIEQIKAQPAEAPDRPLIDAFVNTSLSDVMKRIQRDYNGDYRRFIETEGQAFTQQLKSSFLSSPVYARVENNKLNMDLARKAMADNKSLIGTVDPTTGKYISADEQIQRFRNGETTGFTFRGAYDPSKVNAYEAFGKIYNPNGSKFERAAVPEEDKLAYSQSELGGLAGTDYYFQALRGRRINYKADPIEDRTLFNLDVSKKRSDIAENQSQINRNNAAAAKDMAEARGETAAAATPPTYLQRTFNNVLSNNNVPSFNATSPNNRQVIPGLNVTIGQIATNKAGAPSLDMMKYPNSEASELANESIGITEATLGGKKTYSGRLPGILDVSSGAPKYIDLSNIQSKVRTSDAFIYVDGAEESQRLADGGRLPSRAWKYYEVVVPEKQGKALGLPADKLRVVGKNKDDKDITGYVLKGYTPIPNFVRDKNIDQSLTKKQQGQKQTNEIFNSQQAQPQIFEW